MKTFKITWMMRSNYTGMIFTEHAHLLVADSETSASIKWQRNNKVYLQRMYKYNYRIEKYSIVEITTK